MRAIKRTWALSLLVTFDSWHLHRPGMVKKTFEGLSAVLKIRD
jgi:hypothetical protein